MPTRNALFALFLLLVFVPVGAAAYLGITSLERERAMLIDRERGELTRRTERIRGALVRALRQLYDYESARELTARLPSKSMRMRSPIVERFWASFDDQGRLLAAAGNPPNFLADGELRDWALGKRKRAVERKAVIQGWTLRTIALQPRAANVGSYHIEDDWCYRSVEFDSGERALQGFRVSAERINRLFLDPASPASVLVRSDPRVDAARLVPDDPRERIEGRDAFGLPRAMYRYVVGEKYETPPLAPASHVLQVAVRPDSSLRSDIDGSGNELRWTLVVVGVIVALGLLFLWRAMRAEAHLAERRADFVNAVSHELRTPLTSIRMYADMLKEGWVEDGEHAREYVSLLSAESERLARLVHNVLDFASMEKGGRRFEMQIGDPAPVLRDAVEVLRPYLRSKGFELDLAMPESLPSCSFDRDALVQILVNLIDNAVKYGEKEVRVEASADDGNVRFAVLDRGPGVPAQERERIFQPFERGERARTGGSGLGLALVRHYVEAHAGRIDVGERPGGGAVFAISLPESG